MPNCDQTEARGAFGEEWSFAAALPAVQGLEPVLGLKTEPFSHRVTGTRTFGGRKFCRAFMPNAPRLVTYVNDTICKSLYVAA